MRAEVALQLLRNWAGTLGKDWNMRTTRCSLIIAALVSLVATTAAAVPLHVTQQGRLVDADGDPLNGDHTLEFSLYSNSDGTGQQWTETQTVSLDEGYYTVTLGADSANPLGDSVLSLTSLFLGLSVDSGSLMQPLLEVTSAPYAILADTTLNLDGGYADATALYIEGTLIIDGNGDWVGNALPGSLASLGCVAGEEARYTTVTGWGCVDPGSHYTDAQAIAAVGPHTIDTQLDEAAVDAFVGNNGYSMGAHYDDSQAIAAVGPHLTTAGAIAAVSGDDIYLRNSGDTMTGALRVQGLAPRIMFDSTGASGYVGAEWEIHTSGTTFEVNQSANPPTLIGAETNYLRLIGGSSGSVQLRPDNNTTLTAHANGDVVVDEHIFAERHAFSARTSGSYQPMSGVPLLINHEMQDKHNNYRGSNFQYYQVPRSGIYSLSMSFAFAGGDGSDDTWALAFYKNSPQTGSPTNPAGTLQTLTTNPRFTSRSNRESNASMTAIIDLDAGDRIQIMAFNINSDNPVSIRRAYFSGFYLGD